ncbi:hypothetical protein EHQ76_07405 [Leptospira barantonii]|uniref:Uncharacterized protein n=1 Tax=Leptospira barantonii TaxID=2023184 RepID=A0A5F2BH14_9LEPT|nr:hypothetical protein [Leptospira barantonii]TGM04861.1 hypothetical protein EHQ76_07405 [Leptospira barantonii]
MDFKKDLKDFFLIDIKNLKAVGFKFTDFKKWYKSFEKSNLNHNFSLSQIKNKYKDRLILEKFNLEERIPEPKPRNILYSSIFSCPDKYKDGLFRLEKLITEGGSLFHNLSRQIYKAPFSDGMFLDFGIHHFHLGNGPDDKFPNLIKGTDDVLYCIIYNEYAIFLQIGGHGIWNDTNLIELAFNEFGHIIEFPILKGIGPGNNFTMQERKKIRKKGANIITNLSGNACASLGGGIMKSGLSTKSLFRRDNLYSLYEELEIYVKTMIEENFEKLSPVLPTSNSGMFLKLIDPPKLHIIDTKSDFKAILDYNFESKTCNGLRCFNTNDMSIFQ